MRTRSFQQYVKRQDLMTEAALQELNLGGMASGAMNWARGLWGGGQQQQNPAGPAGLGGTQWSGHPSGLPLQAIPQNQGQNLPLQQQQGPGANLQAQPANNLPLQWSKPDAQANQQMMDALKFYHTNPTVKMLRQKNPEVEQGWQKLASGWKEFKSATKNAIERHRGANLKTIEM